MSIELLEKSSDNIRILSMAMVENAKSGHPGGAMGGADFVNVLYSEFLRFDPDNMDFPFRDRFFLDPGHMSPMLYSILALCGKYSLSELKAFRQWGSVTHGHPELNVKRGIENTSGPLGMGHAMALGSAIAEKFLVNRYGDWLSHKTYAFISDGGIQEEISQGVGRLAGFLGLSNFIMYYDSNDIQLSHSTSDVTDEDIVKKYEAWNWRVEVINGNSVSEIRSALKHANAETEKPTLIVGKTVMGKGLVTESGTPFEKQCSTHGQPVSKAGASFEKSIKNLGGDPSAPFTIFEDVKSFYKEALDKKQKEIGKLRGKWSEWSLKNPELSAKLDKFLSGEYETVDFASIKHKPGIATRVSSGNVLATLAESLDNMIVSSADLSNSDNTNSFLNKTSAFKKGDFGGAFLQAGVSELTMAAVMNGISLHSSFIPVCATFFVFSDYMKPAVRMATLMELQVIYVWTHDSFRVGEDGPTHQPIEQEAQIRLLEKVKNLSGKRSMLVLRPSDSAETTVAWQMALENRNSPTALILTRQNIPEIVENYSERLASAKSARKGAYIVHGSKDINPDLILLGNGSDLPLVYSVALKMEKEKGIKVRVVSVISEGLFMDNPVEYREKILPSLGAPIFGVTSGLRANLCSLCGSLGKVFGLDRFGASAPYTVLEEKFGYTEENIMSEIESYLDEYEEKLKTLKSF